MVVLGGVERDDCQNLLFSRMFAHKTKHAQKEMHIRLIRSPTGAAIQSATVQEMGFIYLTCQDAPTNIQILPCLSFEDGCQIDSHMV